MNDSFPVKYGGKLYDVKNFLRDHPGGINTLKLYKGKGIMHAMEKYGHSISAYHMMKDLFVNPVNSDFEYKSNLKDVNLTGELSEKRRIVTNEEGTRASEEIKFLEELEGRLDWSKPLFNQLEAIAPHYEQWMNTAVYRKCIIFSNPLIEKMTHIPWYLVPIFWVPIILYLGITQYSELVAGGYGDSLEEKPLTNLQFIYHMAIGVFLWTVFEYVLHRWVFHLKPGSSMTMIKIHFLMHGIHHKTPFDDLRQVFPIIPAAIIAVVFYFPLSPMFTYPLVKYTGGLVGYLIYDMIHFYVHNGSPAAGSYLYMMKRYHLNHHFINSDKAYGLCSKLWDYVFRTPVHVKPLEFNLHW